MLMNVILIWVLFSLFFGSREAGKVFRGIIGFFVVMWVIRMVLGFGFTLLPVILVIAVVSKVVVPFMSGFIDSFRNRSNQE